MVDATQFAKSDSPYLKAIDHEDFFDSVTIVDAGDDEYNDQEFIWLQPDHPDFDEKRIRLNKTNLRAIIGEFGADTDAWAGKQIKLSTRPVTMGDGRETVGWVIKPVKKQ